MRQPPVTISTRYPITRLSASSMVQVRRLCCAIALGVVMLMPAHTIADGFQIATLDQPSNIAGTWKFRTGDDPAWAAPNLNDAEWTELKVPLDWGRQGYDGYAGIAWYRLTLRFHLEDLAIEQALGRLAVTLGKVHSAYELYAGGRLIGRVGSLPPEP